MRFIVLCGLLRENGDVTLQETLSYNLTRQKYDVVTTSNGRTALTLAREQKPDLIILDVILPGIVASPYLAT